MSYLILTNNDDYSYLDNNQYTMREGLFEIIQPVKTDIIFIGDSLTQRCEWQELFPEYSVQNRGIGSDISLGVLNRLDVIYSSEPDIIFLMIGVNDIGKDITVDEYIANCRKIAENISEHLPDCKLYIQSILPVKSKFSIKIDEYNRHLKILSEELNLEYIDLYPLFIDENGYPNEKLIGSDGVHLNGDGYKVWTDVLRTYLR